MRTNTKTWRLTIETLFVVVVTLTATGQAYSEENAPSESQVLAGEILMQMAEHLGGTPHFSVTVHGNYDAVQESGQKIEFGEIRKITLNRPDQLRIAGEGSDGVKTLTVFDGKEITLFDEASNVYATEPQPGNLDDTIVYFVKNLGIRLPLAAILLSRLPEELKDRVQAVDYVELTNLYEKPSHHIAARTGTVDFEVWVADGAQPLPLRVVISYKNEPGQPQFRAQLPTGIWHRRFQKQRFP